MNGATPGLTTGAAARPAWQEAFAAALLGHRAAVPAGLLRRSGGARLPLRLAVHRNNVMASLTRTLAEAFPVLHQLVGDDFFFATAREFVAAQPPHTPVLVEYGDTFATWLEAFAPAAGLPYLPDMARLERARVRATHAADRVPLGAAALAARLTPRLLADPACAQGLRFTLHPSLSVIRSPHAVVSLWAAHQGRGHIEDVSIEQPESALVLRQGDGTGPLPDTEVVVVPLADAGAHFALRLQHAATLAEATGDALASDPAFACDDTLALLIAAGAVVACHLPPPGAAPPDPC